MDELDRRVGIRREPTREPHHQHWSQRPVVLTSVLLSLAAINLIAGRWIIAGLRLRLVLLYRVFVWMPSHRQDRFDKDLGR